LFSPGREPNSRSGAVTTSTLAIQIAAQIGGYLRTLVTALRGHPATQFASGSMFVDLGLPVRSTGGARAGCLDR
jgi:hypothetical protein